MIPNENFLFIVGAPRSGTTWLQAMLGAHPLVCTTVELTLYDKYAARWIEIWGKEARNIRDGRWYQGLPFLWTEEEFYGFLREFVERVYRRVLDSNPQATHVLDKHPAYSMYVEDINRILPGARFIHVIRDGRDVAVSMLAAHKRSGFGTGTIERSATAWKKHVLAARNASRYPGRYLEVRYEDLLADGVGTLKAALDFCDLPASADEVADIVDEHQFERMKARRQVADERARASEGHYRKGTAGSWQSELGSTQRCVFHNIAGDLLYELGYAERGWWAMSAGQRLVSPVLATIDILARQARRRIFRAAAALVGPRRAEQIKAARSRRRKST